MKFCFDFSDLFVDYWLNNRSIFNSFALNGYITKDDIDDLKARGEQHYNRYWTTKKLSLEKVIENTINGEAVHYYLSRKYPNIWVPKHTEENKYVDVLFNGIPVEIKSFSENFLDNNLTRQSFRRICKLMLDVPKYSNAEYSMVFARSISFGSNPIVNTQNPEDITYLLYFIYDYNKKQPVFYNEERIRCLGAYNFFIDTFGDIDV